MKISYEAIAKDWDRLRSVPWPVLVEFFEKFGYLDQFQENLLLDLGCGNGRHSLKFAENIDYIVGVDFSNNLLKIAIQKQKKLQLDNVSFVLADIAALPFRDSCFQSIFSLATLHHISSQEDRIVSIKELRHSLKIGGNCLISVWRKWQKRFFKHTLIQLFICFFKLSFSDFGDIYVPWKLQNGNIIQRYYHLFSQRELRKILKETKFQLILLKNFGGPTSKDNIFAFVKRVD